MKMLCVLLCELCQKLLVDVFRAGEHKIILCILFYIFILFIICFVLLCKYILIESCVGR